MITLDTFARVRRKPGGRCHGCVFMVDTSAGAG